MHGVCEKTNRQKRITSYKKNIIINSHNIQLLLHFVSTNTLVVILDFRHLKVYVNTTVNEHILFKVIVVAHLSNCF